MCLTFSVSMSCWAVEDGEDSGTEEAEAADESRCDDFLGGRLNLQLSSAHHLGWISQQWGASPNSSSVALINDCSHMLFNYRNGCMVIWCKVVGLFSGVAENSVLVYRQWAVISTVLASLKTSHKLLHWEENFQQHFKLQDRQWDLQELDKKKTEDWGMKRGSLHCITQWWVDKNWIHLMSAKRLN